MVRNCQTGRSRRPSFFSGRMGVSVFGILALCLTAAGCGRQGVDSVQEPGFEIVTAHPVADGVVIWDPNTEPVLFLAVSEGILPSEEAGVVWRQQGLQVGDLGWRGPVMRLHVDTPGCGYGGQTFEVTAELPGPPARQTTVVISMARYLCQGSPWLDE